MSEAATGWSWWAPGLALHERDSLSGPAPKPSSGDHPRLDRWRMMHGGADQFARRLTAADLDEATVASLLEEPKDALAARMTKPEWASGAEDAAAAKPDRTASVGPTATWLDAFLIPLRPLVDKATDRLLAGTREIVAGASVDTEAVVQEFRDQLGRRLVALAARTLVLQLNVARVNGRLSGADGRERFVDFIEQLSNGPGLAPIFGEYPVLARLLVQAGSYAADAQVELLSRFAADRATVVGRLLDGADPGAVRSIDAWRGDAHQGGRSVAILRFADGRSVVYKPRSVAVNRHFTELVHWLNRTAPGLGLRTAATVGGSGYGWVEFIPAAPCPDAEGVDRFYRRQGALLALLHALHATDIHYENLIACGDQPVLVDLETLFHPNLQFPGSPADPAFHALNSSVYRILLLPLLLIGNNGAIDASGLGGDHGSIAPHDGIDWEWPATDRMRLIRRPVELEGGLNRPRLDDRDVEPGDHVAALTTGFRAGYTAIMRNRSAFLEETRRFDDDDIRLIARPTMYYATLLDESTHPDVLRDALDRDHFLSLLWAASRADPIREQLMPYEAADLWEGDVPLYTTRPGSRDVWTSGGSRLPDLLPAPGRSYMADKVNGFSETDLGRQEWLINATLATRRAYGGHRSIDRPADTESPTGPAGSGADPERMLDAACRLGDAIVAQGFFGDDRVNWLGLEPADSTRWTVAPMGAGLAHGYTGVALFLAQLANVTGTTRYLDVALRAIQELPRVLEVASRHTGHARAVGCGGFDGFAGIGYALARMSTLTGETGLRQWAAEAVELAATAGDGDGPIGVIGGHAGCLAAMMAVHAELGLPSAAQLAAECAGHLADQVMRDPAPPRSGGFAEGGAGVGWALSRYASAHGEPRYALAGLTALRRDHRPADTNHAWCTGTAGELLARAHLRGSADPADTWDVDHAIDVLRDRPPACELGLCHGELGIIEALTVIADRDRGAATARDHRAAMVLEHISQDNVSTPGLLTGLAGVGYGLLRLACADRVPSVLLLEPTPATARVDTFHPSAQ